MWRRGEAEERTRGEAETRAGRRRRLRPAACRSGELEDVPSSRLHANAILAGAFANATSLTQINAILADANASSTNRSEATTDVAFPLPKLPSHATTDTSATLLQPELPHSRPPRTGTRLLMAVYSRTISTNSRDWRQLEGPAMEAGSHSHCAYCSEIEDLKVTLQLQCGGQRNCLQEKRGSLANGIKSKIEKPRILILGGALKL